MKILIAPDSFKGSLSAPEAAQAIAEGIRQIAPQADCILLPVADGGEGTVETLMSCLGRARTVTDHSDNTDHQARIISTHVTGPTGARVDASYGLLGDTTHSGMHKAGPGDAHDDREHSAEALTAVIEMASASGMHLVDAASMDPMTATSFGTGELIRDALDRGARNIIVGLGGSATNDGGAGMAQALGVRLLDRQGRSLPFGGGALSSLHTIDISGIDPRLSETTITLASDVGNPLTGRQGASAVFGPQKGASPAMVRSLDAGLRHFADVVRAQLHRDIDTIPGAGAAGGMGAGFMAFTNASIRSGIDIVIELTHLKELAADADYCFVAEGRMDAQSGMGKAPIGVARAVKAAAPRCKVIGVTASIGTGAEDLYDQGIDAIFSITPGVIPLDEALSSGARNLTRLCRNLMRLLI
ncbi:MAG: glycerate kinase [Bifidobacterium psychraerophilum]|uniref:glycerate kinase n=1 Tax=Bifidobacterium psychraerophilum TaxID=218140 RepID=UPI0039E8512A